MNMQKKYINTHSKLPKLPMFCFNNLCNQALTAKKYGTHCTNDLKGVFRESYVKAITFLYLLQENEYIFINRLVFGSVPFF